MPTTCLRLTPQRNIILEELRGTRSHPTADEVYDMVRRRLPHISLGTIYRNLDYLHAQGLIRKLDKIGSQMRFDASMDPHLHICCMECGKVGDLPEDAASVSVRQEAMLDAEKTFQITGHWLEFHGVCSDCRTKGKIG
ncbi:MAG: transcriptional repressor [Desulfovibrionales bacterium]|nr:MAG: transcriptional repressor [Desulfovibrionales bacterium]